MSKYELRAEMERNGDTYFSLSNAMGISKVTLCNKINQKNTEFTQSEIKAIKNRYNLSGLDVDRIFFDF